MYDAIHDCLWCSALYNCDISNLSSIPFHLIRFRKGVLLLNTYWTLFDYCQICLPRLQTKQGQNTRVETRKVPHIKSDSLCHSTPSHFNIQNSTADTQEPKMIGRLCEYHQQPVNFLYDFWKYNISNSAHCVQSFHSSNLVKYRYVCDRTCNSGWYYWYIISPFAFNSNTSNPFSLISFDAVREIIRLYCLMTGQIEMWPMCCMWYSVYHEACFHSSNHMEFMYGGRKQPCLMFWIVITPGSGNCNNSKTSWFSFHLSFTQPVLAMNISWPLFCYFHMSCQTPILVHVNFFHLHVLNYSFTQSRSIRKPQIRWDQNTRVLLLDPFLTPDQIPFSKEHWITYHCQPQRHRNPNMVEWFNMVEW